MLNPSKIKLYKIQEAMGILSISRTTAYDLMRAGKLKTVVIGKRGVRIPESEIERYITERLQEAADRRP